MLAAIGWPASELEHAILMQDLGMENLLADGKAPSVFNGGLDRVDILVALGVFFGVGAVLEIETARKRADAPPLLKNFYDMWREEDWDEPGNYGFDPLGLSEKLCKSMEDKVTTITLPHHHTTTPIQSHITHRCLGLSTKPNPDPQHYP